MWQGFYSGIFLSIQTGGIKNKADKSKDRTQQLNEAATRAKAELTDELEPKLQNEKLKTDEILIKTKTTKQNVEGIIRYLFIVKFTYIPNDYNFQFIWG